MLETEISLLRAAITENTAALREILSAGSTTPPNVVPISETPKAAKTTKAKPAPEPATPAPTEEPETPTKVAVAAAPAAEGLDPLDNSVTPCDAEGEPVAPPKLDAPALKNEIIETWKNMLTSADAERKVMLKDKFPELRAKWGLKPDDKLDALLGQPENLAGLLADIKSL